MPLHLAGGAKLELFPFNTTVFYLRLENLADDNFDTNYKYYDDHEDDGDVDVIDDDDEEEDEEDDVEDNDDDPFHVGNLTSSSRRVKQTVVPYEEKHPNYVDMDLLVTALVEKHLGGLVGVSLEIAETSLSGSELYHLMVQEKTQWTGYDDDWLDDTRYPRDKDERHISLEPQRIRMFRVVLKPNVRPPKPPQE